MVKVGFRKPNIKSSIKARTVGKAKRKVKKALIPGYGKKGAGWVKDPKKAAYNAVYSRTTVGVSDVVKPAKSKPRKAEAKPKEQKAAQKPVDNPSPVTPQATESRQAPQSSRRWPIVLLAAFLALMGFVGAGSGISNGDPGEVVFAIVFIALGAFAWTKSKREQGGDDAARDR